MQCFVDGCTDTPIATFIWPWGEEGLVCSKHRILLDQKASQLKQNVVVTPLNAGAPAPIELEERQNFHARILALEEDNNRLRTNSMNLFRQLEETKNDGRSLLSAKVALTGQIDVLMAENARLQQAALEATEQAAAYLDELQTLRALLPTEETPTTQR